MPAYTFTAPDGSERTFYLKISELDAFKAINPGMKQKLCLPRINTSDEQEPIMSMADGKMYTSKAAMRESYKPGGNPQGATFVEIGDDQSYKKQAQANRKPDENLIREATERAFADLNAGRLGE